jgi:D-Tyr-tRNAtyr deacylase
LIAVLQRTSHASVSVKDKILGQIKDGVVVLLGVKRGDLHKESEFLAQKVSPLKVFNDKQNNMIFP